MTPAVCTGQGQEEEDCWAKHGMQASHARRIATVASEPTVTLTDAVPCTFKALSTTPAQSGRWHLDSGESYHGQGQEEEDCWVKHGMPVRHARRIANVASDAIIAPTVTVPCTFTALSTTPAQSGRWHLDSGESNRRCREHHLVDFAQLCARPHDVSGHSSRLPVVGSGSFTISFPPAARGQPDRLLTLTDSCLLLGLATNTVSAARLAEVALNVRYTTTLRVHFVNNVLGTKAWRAAIGSALPASLLPGLAAIDSEDDDEWPARAETRTAAATQDVYIVNGQLGTKAWGATARSALPASLLPELATIDSHAINRVFTALSTTPAAGLVLDFAASNHYCREPELVDSLQSCAKPHAISADGSAVPIVGSGSVSLAPSESADDNVSAPALALDCYALLSRPASILLLQQQQRSPTAAPAQAAHLVQPDRAPASTLVRAAVPVLSPRSREREGLQVVSDSNLLDAGEASFPFGIDTSRNCARCRIGTGQSACATALFERHGMSGCKPWSTSTVVDFTSIITKAAAVDRAAAADRAADEASDAVFRDYPAIIAGFVFAMIRRWPDIAYAIITPAQLASSLLPAHSGQTLERVLPYPCGSADSRVSYTSTDSQLQLSGYSDANCMGSTGSAAAAASAVILAGVVVISYVTALLERHGTNDYTPPEHAAHDGTAHAWPERVQLEGGC